MRIVTDNITTVKIYKEADGTESIHIVAGNGRVEITLPSHNNISGVMVTQVFQAVSNVTMATVETSVSRYSEEDFPNTHNTEVIR